MAKSAHATLAYTDEEVSPVLQKTPQHSNDFLPQTIPFYAANTTFKRLRAASYTDYVMREAALNPTNLDDRATEWEVDLITYFRNNPGQTQQDGTRDTPTGSRAVLRHPDHCRFGLPESATARFRSRRSQWSSTTDATTDSDGSRTTWWARRSSRCPWRCPSRKQTRVSATCSISLGAIFLLTVILIDVAMYMIVIRPLRRVSKNADIISKGEIDLPPLEIKGKDEIAEVTASFNRMHTSLVKAFEMLNS